MLSYIWFWKINSKGVVFNMEPFKNFKVAAYVYAYYLEKVDEAEIQRGIDRLNDKIAGYERIFAPLERRMRG